MQIQGTDKVIFRFSTDRLGLKPTSTLCEWGHLCLLLWNHVLKNSLKQVNFELYIFNYSKKHNRDKPAIHTQELMSELHHLDHVYGAMVNEARAVGLSLEREGSDH